MPDMKKTIEEFEQVLRKERMDCMWDHTRYANSSCVYITKHGVTQIQNLLNRAKGEVVHYTDLEAEELRGRTQVANCMAELEAVAADNDALRKQAQTHLALIHTAEARVELLFKLLKEVRGVFGGRVDLGGMKALLARVDEVLK